MNKTLLLLRWMLAPLAVLGLAWMCEARADEAQAPFHEEVRKLVMDTLTDPNTKAGNAPDKTRAPGQPRFEVIIGALDARLRLAPCQQVQPFVPTGMRLWGHARVGLRCLKGVTPWTVYMPVTVNAYGRAMVANVALPVGHVLDATDFREAEVNLTEDPMNPLVTEATSLVGRGLARSVAPGQGLRQNSLKLRQWFAAGDTVQIRAVGNGFAVAGSGEALTAGLEGLPARVKTEAGRIVTGTPVGEHEMEIVL